MLGAQVNVSTTVPTLIATGQGGQSQVTVSVATGSTVYVGDAAVSATTGIPVSAISQFLMGPKDKLYALAKTSAVETTVLLAELGFE